MPVWFDGTIHLVVSTVTELSVLPFYQLANIRFRYYSESLARVRVI